MSECMVSITCLVYNHEKYLRNCLDGFVKQKTTFDFEVLVHDDASTDGSQQIIREYEEAYPNIIKPIYQTENQHSKGVQIQYAYQFPRAKGKYIAFCEGDDYWTDEYKLQKQFDMMEKHPECSICSHRVQCIDEAGRPLAKTLPGIEMETQVAPGKWLIEYIMSGVDTAFHTSSYFLRAEHIKAHTQPPLFMTVARIGDMPRLLLMGSMGDFCYINDIMSHYRTNSVGGWTQRILTNPTFRKKWLTGMPKMLRAFDEYTEYAYHDSLAPEICRREFAVYEDEFDVKAMKRPEFAAIFRTLTLKKQIAYTIAAYIPFSKSLIKRLRTRERTASKSSMEN